MTRQYNVLLRTEIDGQWQHCALSQTAPESDNYTFLRMNATTGLREYVLTKNLRLYQNFKEQK